MPDRSKSGERVANQSEPCDVGTVQGTEIHNCEAPACCEASVVFGGESVCVATSMPCMYQCEAKGLR